MDGPDNKIGDDGAAALVEGLKEMTNITQLDLGGECCMVGIVCQVAVMSWIKQVAGVHTGKLCMGVSAWEFSFTSSLVELLWRQLSKLRSSTGHSSN